MRLSLFSWMFLLSWFILFRCVCLLCFSLAAPVMNNIKVCLCVPPLRHQCINPNRRGYNTIQGWKNYTAYNILSTSVIIPIIRRYNTTKMETKIHNTQNREYTLQIQCPEQKTVLSMESKEKCSECIQYLDNSASTTFGHCVQINFIAVHYAQQLSSTTEDKCNTKLCAYQLNAISWNSAECFSSIINTIQWNRMKWKRVYHIREFQHFSGIECNGLHLQCLAEHLSAFRVESPTMRSAEHFRTLQLTAEHGREQLLRGGDRSVLSGSRHTGILAAPAAIPCAQYHAIPRNTSICNII